MNSHNNDEKMGLDRFNKEINYSNNDSDLLKKSEKDNDINEDDNVLQSDLKNKIRMQVERDLHRLSDIKEELDEIERLEKTTENNEDVKEDIVEDIIEEIKEDINVEDIVKSETINSNVAVSQNDISEDVEDVEEIEDTNEEDLSKTNVMDIPNKNKFVIDINQDEYNKSDFSDDDVQDYYDEDEEDDYEEKSSKKNKRKKATPLGIFFRIIVAFILVGTIAFAAIAAVYSYGDYSGITGNGVNKQIVIPPDTYVSDLGDILKENEIIKYPQVFKLYVKYVLKDNVNLHYGKFNLNSGMGYKEILNVLQNPANSESGIKITIKEGQNTFDIANILQENHICTAQEFLDEVKNGDFSSYEFVQQIDNPDQRMYRLEGYLFPDTYNFKENTEAKEVINTLLSNFDKKLDSKLRYAIEISEYSIDEIVRLASIIQAEAPTKSDMMKVSSVYRNRLADKATFPKLQADPTSKYANRVLEKNGAAAQMVTAYDTYKSEGLPPGAINNPGLEALLSAIYPATTDYYYFCTDLTSKQFYYANDYNQHLENLSLAGLSGQ